MCSIDEAWAGQQFEGSPIVSQADMRMSSMSIPNNLMDMNNQFSVIQKHNPASRYLSRGINSQFSRSPRIPTTDKTLSDGTNIQLSSQMPHDIPPYLGESPRPEYMKVYDNSSDTTNNIPMPSSTHDNFNDFETAFNVSDTVNSFMNQDKRQNLLHENNNNNTNDRKMIEQKNAHATATLQDNKELKTLLIQVLKRLDSIETKLHNGQKNTYDMALYVLIGLLMAFLVYSVCLSIRK